MVADTPPDIIAQLCDLLDNVAAWLGCSEQEAADHIRMMMPAGDES